MKKTVIANGKLVISNREEKLSADIANKTKNERKVIARNLEKAWNSGERDQQIEIRSGN